MDGKIVSVNVKISEEEGFSVDSAKLIRSAITTFFAHSENGVLEINEFFGHSVRFVKHGDEITVQTFNYPLTL